VIVVKNAIEGGTAGLKHFSFFQKKASKPASVPAERRGEKQKEKKKRSGFSCVCIKGGVEKEEGKREYLLERQRRWLSAGRPCRLPSGGG